MTDFVVPKLNNNDESYVVVEWLAADGDLVTAGQPVVTVETSKAQEELEAPAPGILRILVKSGDDCAPGGIVAHLLESLEEPPDVRGSVLPERQDGKRHRDGGDTGDSDDLGGGAATAPDIVITNGARALVGRHGITDDQLRALGRTVIRTSDVEGIISPPASAEGDADIVTLPLRQQAVAAVVTESMRTIPAAAVYVRVGVEAALAAAESLSRTSQCAVGLVELLVKAVGSMNEVHPTAFATPLGDGRVRLTGKPRVGITIDAGSGLFVPFIENPAELTATDIADRLMDFRIKALRGSFRAHELGTADILIALHNTAGVVLATPVVFPGQVCAVSLGDVQDSLSLDESGQVVARRYVNVGLVYDHRVLNGADAMRFLVDLRKRLEEPVPSLTGEAPR